jgi:hypothetical protein
MSRLYPYHDQVELNNNSGSCSQSLLDFRILRSQPKTKRKKNQINSQQSVYCTIRLENHWGCLDSCNPHSGLDHDRYYMDGSNSNKCPQKSKRAAWMLRSCELSDWIKAARKIVMLCFSTSRCSLLVIQKGVEWLQGDQRMPFYT